MFSRFTKVEQQWVGWLLGKNGVAVKDIEAFAFKRQINQQYVLNCGRPVLVPRLRWIRSSDRTLGERFQQTWLLCLQDTKAQGYSTVSLSSLLAIKAVFFAMNQAGKTDLDKLHFERMYSSFSRIFAKHLRIRWHSFASASSIRCNDRVFEAHISRVYSVWSHLKSVAIFFGVASWFSEAVNKVKLSNFESPRRAGGALSELPTFTSYPQTLNYMLSCRSIVDRVWNSSECKLVPYRIRQTFLFSCQTLCYTVGIKKAWILSDGPLTFCKRPSTGRGSIPGSDLSLWWWWNIMGEWLRKIIKTPR